MAVPARSSFSGIDLSRVNPGSFQFLVCGKTGVGKSSLINSLVGSTVCNVNDPGVCTDNGPAASFAPGTLEVNNTSISVKGSPVLAWDSPGLLDGSGNQDQYLQSMCEKCKDVDVVFYCMEMTAVRLTDQDKKAVRVLTQKFGADFWKKTILVLTKANMVAREKDYHQSLYNGFVKEFTSILTGEGVQSETSGKIQCIAAGFFDAKSDPDENERFVWYASDTARAQKNEKVDFIPELWAACFQMLSGKPRSDFVRKSRTRSVISAEETAEREKKKRMEELEKKAEEERIARQEEEREHQRKERERQMELEATRRKIAEEAAARRAREQRAREEAEAAARRKAEEERRRRENAEARNVMTGAAVGAVVAGPVGAVVGGFLGKLFS